MIKKEIQQQIDKGELLPLMEEFYTIQGEGFYTGKAAYFIRIGGCDVGCHWCDVKESWNAKLHPPTKTDIIVENAAKSANTVVITGGEPLMWSLDYITQSLQNKGIRTHIETSGAYPLSGKWDWICLSPKKTKLPLEGIYKESHELKMIIFNKNDFKFAEEQAAKVSETCELFLQPEWSN
ncbi:MAG: 7-carboxy-7-deazaguanine synthase QueE, partial [Lutibacter sp.]|nr:7-carboxy-7-deazaguanine synthase QueE [Lutibacter sp.]